MWEQRQGPWENARLAAAPNGGIFKSTDGGTTWKPLTQGLPDGIDQRRARRSRRANPRRLYATVEAGDNGTGIYRSDDAGETWTRTTTDTRPTSRINEAVPHVHPKDPDTLIVTDIVSYKSTDGGRTFVPFKGAPGGDDNQNIWWNPNNPDIMLLVADQGAVVTLNGGQTWSSWYTQPTAALYHVMTDNAFPVPRLRRAAGQRIGVRREPRQRRPDHVPRLASRSASRNTATPRPIRSIPTSSTAARSRATTGGPVRCRTSGPSAAGAGAAAAARRRAGSYRTVRTQPVVFSTVDPRALFYGNNVLWKTLDGGINWTQISPDLTRETWDVPKSVGTYASRVQARERGAIGAQVIYTIGPSYRDINRIWIGTDDGVIQTTADGGLHWTNVTPPQMSAFMKVFTIDPGRFDPLTAYAAVNTLRLDDMNPHIYRTHDGGKTWKEIVAGIPGGAPVSVVREDPKRKGLLFAGSETQVYVSFDDGDHWQSLRLNMAPSSVRDLVVKDDDLVVGTHGRGIWILDDITPLRQIEATTAEREAVLFKPQDAWRVRWNTNTDTPLPPDEPTAPNPPEGAIINYYLKSAASGPVTLEIVGSDGRLVRRYSSTDEVFKPDPATITVPLYWFRADRAALHRAGHASLHLGRALSAARRRDAGQPARIGGPTLPIAAIRHNTVPAPTTPWVNPGTFTVKLTVNGKTLHAADRGQAGSAREDAGAGDAAGLHAVEGGVLRRGRRAGGGAAGAQGRGPDRQAAAAGDGRRGRGARGRSRIARSARTGVLSAAPVSARYRQARRDQRIRRPSTRFAQRRERRARRGDELCCRARTSGRRPCS